MKANTDIVKSIRLVWESLESHLEASVKKTKRCGFCGDRIFHAKCVKEYAEILLTLANQLK